MFYYTNLESVSPSLVVRIAIQHIYNNYKYIKQYKNDIHVMDGNNVAASVEYLFLASSHLKHILNLTHSVGSAPPPRELYSFIIIIISRYIAFKRCARTTPNIAVSSTTHTQSMRGSSLVQ